MGKFITEYLDTLEGMLLSRKINYITIPYSNDKYRLDMYGQIFNNEDNTKVEVFEKDNTYYVNLDWVNGVRDYNLAKVIIVACRPDMMLPIKYFDDIIPLFRNGDEKDIKPDNLTYDLPKSGIDVDSENFPGFYYIPEHTSYGINKECKILRIKTNLIYTPPVRDPKDKVRNNIKLTNDRGRLYINYLYRLLAMTFIEHGSDYESLTVNHKDGNHQNDVVENLEWITKADNNTHAFENDLIGTNTKIKCKNYLTKQELGFRSIIQCSKHFNIGPEYVSKSLKIGFMKITSDPKDFYYITQNGSIYNSSLDIDSVNVKAPNIGSIKIKSLNVLTNVETIWDSTNTAAKELGTTERTIRLHIERNSLMPTIGYIFRNLDDKRPYPVFTNDQLYVIKENLKIDNGNRIVATKAFYVTDLKTGEKTFWLYPQQLVKFLNISDTLLHNHFHGSLDTKEFTFHNRYRVSVIRLEGTMPI